MGLIILKPDGERIELSWDDADKYGQTLSLDRLDTLRHWCVNFDNLTIEHVRGPGFYYVDLERCLTSADVLDWIFQIHRKRWGSSDGVVEELLWLLGLLLQPQANLCTGGLSKKIPKRSLRKLVQRNFKRGVGLQVESGIIPPPKRRRGGS
jgi:hypothetical protein